MNRTILVLSNIYNFIGCSELSGVQCSLSLLDDFRLIQYLLTDLVVHGNDPKKICQELQISLIDQEKALGPKKFKQLIQNITTIIIEHVVSKIRSREIEKGVLCMTYFERNCARYLNSVSGMLIALTLALAQLAKSTPQTMKKHLLDSYHLLTQMEKANKQDLTTKNLRMLHSLFAGIYHYEAYNLTKARGIFNEMISTLTTRIHQQQQKTKNLEMTTITYFVLATHFLSQSYRCLGENDLANYNLTQSLQFAERYLPDHEPLLLCYEGNVYMQQKTVKLSRIENKIERIKSLHFTTHPRWNHSKQVSYAQVSQIKAGTHKKEASLPVQVVEAELNKIFTLQEPKSYTLKKRTLIALNYEAQRREDRIQHYHNQIDVFHSKKEEVDRNYQLQAREEQLKATLAEKKALRAEVAAQMWSVVGTLKPTHKISTYITAFRSYIAYESSNKFFRFLCSNVGVMGHMVLYCFAKRYRAKLIRHKIRVVTICHIKHQLQFLTHKINKTFHIKVYNIQSGNGVDDAVQVSDWLYDKLHQDPINYHFNIQDGKLVPLDKYLERLSLKTLCQVKLFVGRLKYKLLRRKKLINNQKHVIPISFGNQSDSLTYTIFITSRALPDGKYSHFLERIDNKWHVNSDYNLSIKNMIINEQPLLKESQLNRMLTECILNSKERHMYLIIKIQKMFRRRISKSQFVRRQEGVSISTTQIGNTLFTLSIKGNNKTFFIEHLGRMYKTIILKSFAFNSLAFVNKLRDQLQVTDNNLQHMKIIQKYFKIRNIYRKLTKRSKQLQLENTFSTKFKISLCFAKKTKHIIYKEKKVDTDAMYMLTVKDFESYPRKYQFRAFNLESQSLYCFDIKMEIENAEKCFLQNNLDKIYQTLNIIDFSQAKIIIEGKAKSVAKSKRPNSKSTVFSNYSNFVSGQNYVNELPKQKIISRLQARQSYAFSRNRKNSIHFKMRHKSALKQKDILLIKKWIEDSKENQCLNVSEEESDDSIS